MKMKHVGTAFAVITLAGLIVLIAGCGGSSQKQVTVHLTGNDQMQYNKTQFTVPAGAQVKLVFEHVGKLPLKVMGHDVVILKKDQDAMKFGKEIAGKGKLENNDIPPSMMDHVLAHTKLIGGGETTSITFTAPPTGEYDYLCSFPAHYITMNGKMIVE